MSRCCPAAPEPQRSSTSKTSAIPKPHSWSATTTTGQDATPPRLNGSGSPFNIHPQPEIQDRMKTSCGTPLRHCHTSNFSLPTTAARSPRQARTHSKFTPTHHAAAATKKSLHVWHPRSYPRREVPRAVMGEDAPATMSLYVYAKVPPMSRPF